MFKKQKQNGITITKSSYDIIILQINSLDDIQNASPNSDYDDFDVISNRAKTLNSTNNNSESNNSTQSSY